MHPTSKTAIFVVLSACAQIARAADAPAFRVTVSHIAESRNTEPPRQSFGSRGVFVTGATTSTGASDASVLSLTLAIASDSLPANYLVRDVRITKAVDNLDRKLAPVAVRTARISPDVMARGGGTAAGQPLAITSSFIPPDRDVDSLKLVEGTIEIFVPSEANGSMIRIANIKSHPGRVEHPALTRAGIEFRFLRDKTGLDEVRSRMTGGASNGLMDPSTGYGVQYRDLSSKLIGYMLQDAAGNIIPIAESQGGGNSSGILMSHSLSSPLTDDMQLVIFLAVPEAIKVVPFQTGSVMLP